MDIALRGNVHYFDGSEDDAVAFYLNHWMSMMVW